MLDPTGSQVANQIAQATEAGDPGPARNYVAANCDNVRWLSPS